MPGGTRAQLGNELFAQIVYIPAVTYPTIAANSIASNTLTIAGVLPGDLIDWSIQNPPAHLAMENIWVNAANQVTITWSSDASGISTGSIGVIFEVTRPENGSQGLAALPASLA